MKNRTEWFTNARFGAIAFYEGGRRKTLIVPRIVAAGFERATPTWLKAVTASTRWLNAALTTNNPAFVPFAMSRDLGSAAHNVRGLHRPPIVWPRPALGHAAARLPHFIPPAPMRALGEHPLARKLIGPQTIEYWTSFGHAMARLIHSGDFRGELERARQDRLAGREAQAREREYLVQMSRQALRDGILLSMVQFRQQDYDESDFKSLFAEYGLDFDELPAKQISTLRKITGAPGRAWRAYWNAAGTASEIASATVKLAAYCYLHRDLTPDTTPPPAPPTPEPIPAPPRSSPLRASARALPAHLAPEGVRAGFDGASPHAQATAYRLATQARPTLETTLQAAARAIGAELRMRPGLNSETRAAEKVAQDYAGDWAQLPDLIGGTLALEDTHTYQQALDAIAQTLPHGAAILRVKKLNMHPGATGCQDVKINIRLPNGTLAETILVPRRTLHAKQHRGGHKLYELRRIIEKNKDKGIAEIDDAISAIRALENALYAEAPSPDFASMKARASASVQALQRSRAMDAYAASDINAVKSLSSGIQAAYPPSVDSNATPADSQIKNGITQPPFDAPTNSKSQAPRQAGGLSTHAAARLHPDAPPDAPSFRGTLGAANVWRLVVMAGDPTFDIRGAFLSLIEFVTGPFLNARVKGTLRTFQGLLDTRPTIRLDGRKARHTIIGNAASRAGKFAAVITQRTFLYLLAAGALGSGGACLALFRKWTGNADATPKDMQGTPIGALAAFLDAMAQGYRNCSPYILQNSLVLPLYVNGDVTLALTMPVSDEDRIPILIVDAIHNRLNAWTPDPTTGPADILAEATRTVANPSQGEGTLLQFRKLLAPWLENVNPYDPFRQTTMLSDEEFATRWTRPDAAQTVAGRLVESSPLALLWKPPKTLSPENRATLDQTGWLADFHAALTRTPVLSSIGGRFIRVQVGGETARVRKLRRLDQQQALAIRLLARQNFALTQLGLPPQIPQDLPIEYAKDYFEAWFARQDEHLAARSSAHRRKRLIQDALAIRDPNLRAPALRATR